MCSVVPPRDLFSERPGAVRDVPARPLPAGLRERRVQTVSAEGGGAAEHAREGREDEPGMPP